MAGGDRALNATDWRTASVGVLVVILFALSLAAQPSAYAQAGQVALAWNANTESTLGGYQLHYGQTSGNYTANVDVGNTTSYSLGSLQEGQTYYFAVKAYAIGKLIWSGFSNEVSKTIPTSSTAPIASFSANPTSGVAPLTVTFADTSTGTISTGYWTLGDSTTSTATSGAKTYSTPGTYTMSLTVTGPGGSSTSTKTITATATDPNCNTSEFSACGIGLAKAKPLRCVAFSPYVRGYDPRTGPHPGRRVIRTLLDRIVEDTSFRCIITYGVLNGLEDVFTAAKERKLKVIAILWLDGDPTVDDQSITKGIEAAKKYTKTIMRLSCGSEVRTRHGNVLDHVIVDCINRLRAASVTQPITSIDSWWEWCNRSPSCALSNLAGQVDWIGINVFPWWENKFSGIFTCTTARQAPGFHIARLRDVMQV